MRQVVFRCLCLLFIALTGRADADPADILHVTAAITPTLSLTLGPSSLQLPTPAIADLDLGYIQTTQAFTLVISSNVNYAVCVKSLNANLGTVGTYTKPLGHLLWRLDGSANFTPITQNDAVVQSGKKGTYTKYLDIRMLAGWNDLPGTYSAVLTFVISAT